MSFSILFSKVRRFTHICKMQSTSKKRILLLSTIHPANDQRIVGKVLPTLQSDFEVKVLLPQQPLGNDLWHPRIAFFKQLWLRILLVHPVVLGAFLWYRPQIVHIFVAELLPLAFVFRWLGADIVYEVQENLYKKIPTKTYNKGWLFEQLFRYFDQKARRHFYFVFTEDAYLKTYQNLTNPHAVVHNFADPKWLSSTTLSPFSHRPPVFFYAGVISFERGFDTMLAAVALVKKKYPDVLLKLFGHRRFADEQMHQLSDYEFTKDNLVFFGYVSQTQAFAHAQEAVAGIALLKPVGDYADSYPTKLFDYMALGLPVLTSDLPLLRAVVEVHQCGFCVGATDAHALAEKMLWLIENPEAAAQMAHNGQEAVRQHYNWESEGRKLKSLYDLVQ
jgi:glycosyltransferase involved in cell wall biosynthesis